MPKDGVMKLKQMSDVSKNRSHYIGGSCIPIIMELSPFKNRYTLLKEKSEIKDVDFVSNPYIDYGNTMESVIRDFISQKYDRKFEEFTYYWGDVRYNCDGSCDDMVLEIKTTSKIKDDLNGYKLYLVQLLMGMYLNDSDGLLVVYHRPKDFDEELDESRMQIFEVKLEEHLDLMVEILDALEHFRQDLNIINYTYIEENRIMEEEELLPVEVVTIANRIEKIEKDLAFYKSLQSKAKEEKQKLYDSMEKHKIKSFKTIGGLSISRVLPTIAKKKTKVDVEQMMKDHPELVAKYTYTYLENGKKGYMRITQKKEEENEK